MTKTWHHKTNGQSAIFAANEDMTLWPDYQDSNPTPPPAITKEQEVRDQRNEMLAWSDQMALSDRITDEWRVYRQALRDLSAQSGFPESVTWPEAPEIQGHIKHD